MADADLLRDKEATTNAGMIAHLSMSEPTIRPVYDQRFVESGKIITSGGLSAGIDGALHIVSLVKGQAFTREISNNMEYDWDERSEYVRTYPADFRLLLDFNPPLFNRKTLIYEGDEFRWHAKYEVLWRGGRLLQFKDQFRSLAREAGWKVIQEDEQSKRYSARWSFADFGGQSWNCQTDFNEIDERGTLQIEFKLQQKDRE